MIVKLTLVALSLVLGASTPLEVKVTPTQCISPCSVRIDVKVDPHPANRWLVYEADSEDAGTIYQATARQLEGERSPRTQREVWFHGLPPGLYEVKVILYRMEKNEVARVVRTVRVI